MSSRPAAIQRVLFVTLGLNLSVAAAKLAIGSMAGSIALWADGLHSTLDASSNVVALIGIWFAHRPPDDSHPYGHRKFEAVAALAIAAFLFFACFEVLTSAVDRFRGGSSVTQSPLMYAVVVVTFFVNLF